MKRLSLSTLLLITGAMVPWHASAVEPETLRSHEAAQRRAQQMAQQLVATILDIQLQQFEDNGLTDHEIYGDIRAMRNNVDRLVREEMRDVVDFLTKAQTAAPKDRTKHFNSARNKIRDVVARLSAERHRLLRRMRMAEMDKQARHLLRLQRETLELTRQLPEIKDIETQETGTLAAIESQRDVTTLFLGLTKDLTEISGWGPPFGPAAADGLRMLRAHRVKPHLHGAIAELEAIEFEKAILHQEAIVKGLAAVLEQVKGGSARGNAKARRPSTPVRSADELAKEIALLRDLQKALAATRKDRKQIEAQAVDGKPKKAIPHAKNLVAAITAARSRFHDLPDAVARRLAQAEAAATDLAASGPSTGPFVASDLFAAGIALDRTEAELQRTIADTKRRALGVKIGELARAVEALERSSAAEQRLANILGGDSGTLQPKFAKDYAAEQEKVADILEQIAEATENTAPSVANKIAEVRGAVEQAAAHLKKANVLDEEADQASKEADKLADDLAAAAAELRKEIARAAEELAKITEEQLKAVANLDKNIEAQLKEADTSPAEKLARLNKAASKIREAQLEQERAAGREEAVRGLELLGGVEKALEHQDAAEQAAQRFAQGNARSPLDAINELQKAVDELKALVDAVSKRPSAKEARKENRPDQLARAIAEAQDAAEAAIHAGVAGNEERASQARKAASKALEKAKDLARTEANQASQKPAAAANEKAQKKVTEAAKTAQELVSEPAPEAADRLSQAAEESSKAAEQIAAGQPAQAAQKAAAASLAQAAAKVEDSQKKIANEAAKQLAKQAPKLDEKAKEAAAIDAATSEALRQAKEAAEKAVASANKQAKAKETSRASDEVKKKLKEASDNLQAKKQDLERDLARAEAFKKLAEMQQNAREQLAQASQELAKLADQQETKPQDAKKQPSQPQSGEAQSSQPPKGAKPASAKPPSKQENTGGPSNQPTAPPQQTEPPSSQQQQPPSPPQSQPQDDAKKDKKKKKKAVEKLTNSIEGLVESAERIGEIAKDLAKQKEVANKPLKKALKLASKLKKDDLPKGKNPEFNPTDQPLFEPAKGPNPFKKQESGSGALPKQQPPGKKGENEAPIDIPPQTQGPQQTPPTDGQGKALKPEQVSEPPDEGVNASQTVQTAPINSPPQEAAPAGEPGVFEPNEGKPKAAKPTSQSTPPMGAKKEPKPSSKKPPGEKKKEKKPRRKPTQPSRPSPQAPQAPPPLSPMIAPKKQELEETARQLAGDKAIEEAVKQLEEDEDEEDVEDDLALLDPEPEPQNEELLPALPPQKAPEPEEAPGDTGTTPGDLGMGQGTPGKGVGGESTGKPTEDKPQKGDQHGEFQGSRPWATAPPVNSKKAGLPPPPGFKPEKKQPPEFKPGNPEKLEAPPGEPQDQEDWQSQKNEAGAMGGRMSGASLGGTRKGDAALARRKLAREPWFTKLPPEVQDAIRRRTKRNPPRGYEQRLRRYFENVD